MEAGQSSLMPSFGNKQSGKKELPFQVKNNEDQKNLQDAKDFL